MSRLLLCLVFTGGLWLLTGCTTATTIWPASTPITPTITRPPTATPTLSPTATAIATLSPTPSQTPTPSPTLTPTSSPTISPSPTQTHTPTITPTPIDRACPDPPPEKPAYSRYYLSWSVWPTPLVGEVEPHFWLAPPFAENEKTRSNDQYPYGSDGSGRYLLHNGIDLIRPLGTPILAADDGTIIVAQDDLSQLFGWRCNWYGQLVVLQLDQWWQGRPVYVLYGHVLNLFVTAGQQVAQGQPIAEVGFGGVATVPHLHIEVRIGSNEFDHTTNPALWFTPLDERGVIAGRIIDPNGRPWQGVPVHAAGVDEGTTNGDSWTYLGDPQQLIQPDLTLAENFVIGDLTPGRYEISVYIQGKFYVQEVLVRPGRVTPVEIITEPFQPTPEP